MTTALVTLIQNAALLLAMMVVFDLITGRKPVHGQWQRQALAGVILGGLCIGLMMASFRLETGIIFDTRSVLLSLSGLFLGPVPTVFAMVMAAAYRLWLGGAGVWTGIAVILATGGVGIFWRHYRPGRLAGISIRELCGFGVSVHLVMLALMLTLPWEVAQRVLGGIGLPVLLVYPIATIALGWLLANRLQRESATAALAASETRYRNLFEAANVGKSLTLPTGEMEVNRAFCDMLGYDAEELRGKTWQEITPPEEIGPINERLAPLLQGERNAVRFEKRYIHKNGSYVWADVSATVQRDRNGNPLHFIVTAVDITERRRAEDALRESEATVRKKLKSIVDPEGDISTLELSDIMDIEIMQAMMEEFYRATGMLGAVLDLSGNVLVAVGWQDICARFHRCHPDTLKNCMESDTVLTQGVPSGTFRAYQCKNNMWDIVTPLMVGDRHVGNVFFGQFFYEGETPDVELFRAQARQHGFDETEYLAALARVPFFSRDTVEAGMRFYARLAKIVTTLSYNAIKQARMLAERDRLRKELITLNTGLELKVEQRTAALDASNKELEAFSYSVSHDLRAPLRHISGYVDLLNKRYREALPEKARHYLSEVTDSAKQMGILIDDLLQLSRVGRQELRRAELDMGALVRDVVEKLKAETQERSISWAVADLPRVVGDPGLLKQVWINLLDNAVKYTRNKAEAKIEVGCTRETGHWVFFVRDNGAGFDMRYAHKLFGVFQRLHSAAQFEGTGIGLANVQRIVHKHGGRVWAEGRLDEDAAFYFTMPDNQPAEKGGRHHNG